MFRVWTGRGREGEDVGGQASVTQDGYVEGGREGCTGVEGLDGHVKIVAQGSAIDGMSDARQERRNRHTDRWESSVADGEGRCMLMLIGWLRLLVIFEGLARLAGPVIE